jgi:heptosyltransferase-2/heptosyltransferase-3
MTVAPAVGEPMPAADPALPAPGAPVVVRFGAMGDLVLVTPLARALAARHGAPCTVIGHGGWVAPLMRGLPFVGAVRTLKSRGAWYWFAPDQQELVAFLRAARPGPLYLLESDAKSQRLVARAGLVPAATIARAPNLPNEHVVDHHARLAGFAAGYDRNPALAVSAEEAVEAAAWLQGIGWHAAPLVVVQPGNKRSMKGKAGVRDLKHWPEERWAAVVRGVLAAQPAARVLIAGTPSEAAVIGPIVELVGDTRCRSGADDLPLRRLFAILARAHSLISVDTGPAHAAAALGCPVTVLFGKTDPFRNRPVGRARVSVVAGPPDAPPTDSPEAWAACHDMAFITPEAVLAAWTATV